jgi:hypothetical protein
MFRAATDSLRLEFAALGFQWATSLAVIGEHMWPGSSDAAPAGAVDLHVHLRTVWMSVLAMNKTASVVLQASTDVGGASTGPAKLYRGDRTSINMWGSQSEFNTLLNQVFAEAMNGLAADLRPLCAPKSASHLNGVG